MKKKAKSSSGPTITATQRAERGQVQLGLRLLANDKAALVAAIDTLRRDSETNSDVILRVVTRAAAALRK